MSMYVKNVNVIGLNVTDDIQTNQLKKIIVVFENYTK